MTGTVRRRCTSLIALGEPLSGVPAWKSIPSWYLVAGRDNTIGTELERFMAKRMGAKTIEINASHLALISQPDAITNLIMDALAV